MVGTEEISDMQVITVTLSPVFDKTLWIRNFSIGKTFLASQSETYAGGKGVNVSRALLNFSIRTTATGILGDEGKDTYRRLLDADGIEHAFFITRGPVRTNITVVSPETGRETHLREKGLSVHNSVLLEFAGKLQELKDKSINEFAAGLHEKIVSRFPVLFIFAGGLPTGLSQHTYRELIETVTEWKCPSILDASGEAFREGVRAAPLLIKPNMREVGDALGFLPSSNTDFIKAVETFHNMGTERVMISRGKDGIVYSCGNGILEARLVIKHPINTVGSGDCAVAGGVIGIIRNLSDEDTARLACAMGGANTLISGAGRFSKDEANKLLEQVQLDYLKNPV